MQIIHVHFTKMHEMYVITLHLVCRVDAIYEKVDENGYDDVAMTTNPAYEGVTVK